VLILCGVLGRGFDVGGACRELSDEVMREVASKVGDLVFHRVSAVDMHILYRTVQFRLDTTIGIKFLNTNIPSVRFPVPLH
jgi:hypothetical protein